MGKAFQIPDHNGSVLPATGEKLSIGTHFEGSDYSLMCFFNFHAYSALYIPPAQHPIAATANQLVSTGTSPRMGASAIPTGPPSQRLDHTGMTLKGMYSYRTLNIPEEEFPTAAVATPTG